MSSKIRVWDLPTRLFHWLLVAAVTTAVISGEIGGDAMAVHGVAGLLIVGLLAFRLVWGVLGSTHARFVHFAPTPRSVKAYLQGRWRGHGHNPLGALSVFALLALLAAQAGTGLFGYDEIAFSGPLFALVDEALALRLTGLHRQLAYVLLAVVALHVAAILVYLHFKKNNLIAPMLTGWKQLDADSAAGAAPKGGGWVALLLALMAAAVIVYFASGAQAGGAAPVPLAAPAW